MWREHAARFHARTGIWFVVKLFVKDLHRMSTSPAPHLPAPTRHHTARAVLAGAVLVLGLGLTLSSDTTRTWSQVVTLGVVEGLTEFLPISSTAHLLIATDLLRFQQTIEGTFAIFIQLGAILAVVGYYARDLWVQARAVPAHPQARRFWLAILLAFIPAAIVGMLLRKRIKAVLFASPPVIAGSLIVGGIILIAVELQPRRPATMNDPEDVSFGQALGLDLLALGWRQQLERHTLQAGLQFLPALLSRRKIVAKLLAAHVDLGEASLAQLLRARRRVGQLLGRREWQCDPILLQASGAQLLQPCRSVIPKQEKPTC
jgi:hypothetical protein